MADLLTEIRAELRRRLDESRAAVLEYDRLTAALEALEEQERAQTNGRAPSAPRAKSKPKARAKAKPKPKAKQAKRAAPGANREAVLRVVGERPGVSAGELSSAASVSPATLQALLRRLVEAGELEKQELPGGRTGYKTATKSDEN